MNTMDKLFATNKVLENEGVEVPVGINAKNEQVILIIGAYGNPKHEKALSKYEKLLQATKRSPERTKEVMVKILSEGVLFGWKGFLDDDDKPLKYTTKLGATYLLEHRVLFGVVTDTALDEQNFKLALDKEDARNLKK